MSARNGVDSRLALVVAMAENRVIGRDGDLPWRLPKDLKHFKRLTLDHTVIMGRKTYESIGRPLPRRRNVVLTRRSDFSAPGIETFGGLPDALTEVDAKPSPDPSRPDLFVIGGASLYAEALPRSGHLFLTRVHAEVEGDVFFPEVDWSRWRLIESERHEADDKHFRPYTFEHYVRLSDR